MDIYGYTDDKKHFYRASSYLHNHKYLALEDQLAALDALETRVDNLQAALFKYADATLTDEERYSRIKNGVFYSNIDSKFSTTEPKSTALSVCSCS